MAFAYICLCLTSQPVQRSGQKDGYFLLDDPLSSSKHFLLVYENKQSSQPGIQGLPLKNQLSVNALGPAPPSTVPWTCLGPKRNCHAGLFSHPGHALCFPSSIGGALGSSPAPKFYPLSSSKPSPRVVLHVPFLPLRDLISPSHSVPSARNLLSSCSLPPPSIPACVNITYL